MAVDAWLIITTIITSGVLLVGIGMSIVYMQHLDDRNTAWLPKVIVLFGLFLSCANVLILPLSFSKIYRSYLRKNCTQFFFSR